MPIRRRGSGEIIDASTELVQGRQAAPASQDSSEAGTAQAAPELAGTGAALKAGRVNPLLVYANALDAQVRQGGISAEQACMDPDGKALAGVLMGGSTPKQP